MPEELGPLALVPHRDVGEDVPQDPDRDGRRYRVAGHWFSHDDVWMTAVVAASGKRRWTTRFERHARVVAERDGRLVVLALAGGDELALYEMDPATGDRIETARLGFGAYELGSAIHVHRGLAYVPGPGRIVAIDLEGGAIAWKKRVEADKVHRLVNIGDEVYAAWSARGLGGPETALAHVDRNDGRTEPVLRVAADCHGLLANDHALFARIESSAGNIPFGNNGVVGVPASGGEPILVPGHGRTVAGGRFFLLLNGTRADLVTATPSGLVHSSAMFPTEHYDDPRIVGSLAYVPTPGTRGQRRWFAIDLEAFSRLQALPAPTPSRALLEVAHSPLPLAASHPERPPPPSRARSAAQHAADERDLLLAPLPESFLRFREKVQSARDVRALLEVLGFDLLDPRGRWSARPGRDPSLVDFAQLASGDYLCFVAYPERHGEMPVVRLPAADNRAQWIAQDFDAFLATWLADRREERPVAVEELCALFDVETERAEQQGPPEWFVAAHEAKAPSLEAALDDIHPAEDVVRERMLIARAIVSRGDDLEQIAFSLAAIYARLEWEPQRRYVRDAWFFETR